MRHISYLSFYDSPIGLIRINTSEYDILSITLVDEEDEGVENHLSIRVKNELDSYFKGELKSFSFYNYLVSGLQARVLEIVSHIPYGEVITYKEVAGMLGNEDVVSPVIKELLENPFPILLPCHRVIVDENDIGDYVFGTMKKEFLLEFERNNKESSM